MEFFRVYGRVIGLLRDERWLAVGLALANVAVAALQFYEPVLFGKVVDLLSGADRRSTEALWHDAVQLLVLWAAIGIGGIVAGAIGGVLLSRIVGSFVPDVQMPGLAPIAGAALVLVVAAMVASVTPAARASRVDVVCALRAE